jgi:hypothetical protein
MLFSELAGKHQGKTIYVLGSGKSVEFYDPAFFSDKLTVATNDGWSNWLPCVNYMVTKYHSKAQEWSGSDRLDLLVVSRGNTGQGEKIISDSDNFVVFDHAPNRTVNFTENDFPDEGLVVSYSTITSALHLAAIMGARHIVTVGADCGWFDEVSTVEGHEDTFETPEFPLHFDIQNRIVAQELRKRFGCSVSSMLPFVTPNMEGHKFTSPFGSLNA